MNQLTGLLIAFLAAIVVAGTSISWTWLIGTGWEPAPNPVVVKMLTLAEVREGDVVYDLGSGDGRVLVKAVRDFGAKAVGIEADPIRWFLTWLNIRRAKIGAAKVIWGNFFKVNLSGASVVVIFLSRGTNRRLRNKFLRELSPGTRIVSYFWPIDGWESQQIDPESKIYIYRVPDSGGSDSLNK